MTEYRAITDAVAKADASLGTLRDAVAMSRERRKQKDPIAYRHQLLRERERAIQRVESISRELIEVTAIIAQRC